MKIAAAGGHAILLAFLLSGCSSGPVSAPPVATPPVVAPAAPIPAPTPIPRPGALAYSANWTAPLGVTGQCLDDGPGNTFQCASLPGATWAVLPQPGNGGLGCMDPEPNGCFQPAGGVLGFSAGNPGMALIYAQPVSATAPISIEAVVTANLDCTQPVSYVGPVLYNGEGPPTDLTGNYFALYLSCPVGQPIQAWVYQGQMNIAAPAGPATYANSSTHALRIDFVPGVSVTYLVDEVVVHVDTIATITATALTFAQPPHPALWFGASTGSVGRFDWWVGN